ncbi:type III pantothenate kinase [Kaarinaea lacus]
MHLLVDVGNSSIKWNVYDSDSQSFLLAPQSVLHQGDDLTGLLKSQWQPIEGISAVVIANVAGEAIAKVITGWIVSNWQITPRFIHTEKSAHGVINGYRDYRQLGVDRWLALLAAHKLKPNHDIGIISCGTATTVDAVTANGEHLGGLIAPGRNIMRISLQQKTQGIDDIAPAEPPNLLGNDTKSCVNSGVFNATVGFVNQIIDELGKTFEDGKEHYIFITGGDVQYLLPHLNQDVHFEPELVLKGLALFAGNPK